MENKNEQTTELKGGEKKKRKKERKSLVKIRICNDNVRNHQFKQQEIDLNRENGVEIREK